MGRWKLAVAPTLDHILTDAPGESTACARLHLLDADDALRLPVLKPASNGAVWTTKRFSELSQTQDAIIPERYLTWQ